MHKPCHVMSCHAMCHVMSSNVNCLPVYHHTQCHHETESMTKSDQECVCAVPAWFTIVLTSLIILVSCLNPQPSPASCLYGSVLSTPWGATSHTLHVAVASALGRALPLPFVRRSHYLWPSANLSPQSFKHPQPAVKGRGRGRREEAHRCALTPYHHAHHEKRPEEGPRLRGHTCDC